jgi:glycosyltransferase involved in cell wall biosynthesis
MTSKLKVMFVSYLCGISERSLQIIGEHMNKDFFDVHFCIWGPGGVRVNAIRKNFPVDVLNLDLSNFKEYVKGVDLLFFVRSGGYNPYEAFMLREAKRTGVKGIIEWNVFGTYDPSKEARLIDYHLMVSKTSMLRYVKRAGISVKEFLKIGKVLYYPIEIEKFNQFKPTKGEIDDLREKFGLEQSEFVLGRFGRPDPTKFDRFPVDFMRILVKRLPSVRYLAVGGIPKSIAKLIQKYSLDKYFLQTPLISDDRLLIKFYHLTNIIAHSSRIGESFGQAIAEGMAASKPVIVNSTPWADNAQIELVDNFLTGFVSINPESYAEAVEYLILNKNLAEQMGKRGFEKAKKLFDAEIITKTLEKYMIETLLRKGIMLSQEMKEYAENICPVVSSNEIINYSNEYNRRLKNLFRPPTWRERIHFELKYYPTVRMMKRKLEDRITRLGVIHAKMSYTPVEKLYTR